MLSDWRSAAVDERIRATLGLLEKMTLAPEQVGVADIDAIRALGVSDEAISEALHVCFMFNLIDRLADALGWHVQTDEQFAKDAKFLLRRGYDLIGPVRKRALARP